MLRAGFFGWEGWKPATRPTTVGNGTVALAACLLLFMLPREVGARGGARGASGWLLVRGGRALFGGGARLLDASAIQKISWSVPLLMGGGFAIGDGIKSSGLGDTIGSAMADAFAGMNAAVVPLLLIICTALVTEVLSDSATATIFLPIFATVAGRLGQHPLALMLARAAARPRRRPPHRARARFENQPHAARSRRPSRARSRSCCRHQRLPTRSRTAPACTASAR
jgi:Na+/H+ antiporter NhaD/arsenite permease-like protein